MSYPSPPSTPGPHWNPPSARVSPGVLVGLSLWRLLIVACSFIGFGAAVARFSDPWPGLSQQASLVNGLVYLGLLLYPAFTGGRRHEPRSPWLRGAMCVLLLLVGGTFLTIMEGDVDETWSLFEHVLTPLVVLIDWIAVGRNQAAVRWWHPLTWASLPLAYLVYFLAADPGLYGGFLDPDDSGFAGTVVGFLFGVVATGYLLYGIGKLRSGIAAAGPVPGGPVHPSQGYPPPGYPAGPQQPPQPQPPPFVGWRQ